MNVTSSRTARATVVPKSQDGPISNNNGHFPTTMLSLWSLPFLASTFIVGGAVFATMAVQSTLYIFTVTVFSGLALYATAGTSFAFCSAFLLVLCSAIFPTLLCLFGVALLIVYNVVEYFSFLKAWDAGDPIEMLVNFTGSFIKEIISFLGADDTLVAKIEQAVDGLNVAVDEVLHHMNYPRWPGMKGIGSIIGAVVIAGALHYCGLSIAGSGLAAVAFLKTIWTRILNWNSPFCHCCGEKHTLHYCDCGGVELAKRAETEQVELKAPAREEDLLTSSVGYEDLRSNFNSIKSFQEGRSKGILPTYKEATNPTDENGPHAPTKEYVHDTARRLRQAVRVNNPGGMPQQQAKYAQAAAYIGLKEQLEIRLKQEHTQPDDSRLHGDYYGCHAALMEVQATDGHLLGHYNEAAANLHLRIKRKSEDATESLDKRIRKKQRLELAAAKKAAKRKQVSFDEDEEFYDAEMKEAEFVGDGNANKDTMETEEESSAKPQKSKSPKGKSKTSPKKSKTSPGRSKPTSPRRPRGSSRSASPPPRRSSSREKKPTKKALSNQ